MRVDWVHPSWRDLAIEALAADTAARRHFLARCGVDGAALALSFGGGAGGERERPLLRCDADWDALGDGVYALCHDCDEIEAIQLLNVLEAAGHFDEVLALARLVIDRLGWAGKAVSVDALAAWLPVAARLAPPPEPPTIPAIWLELEPGELPRTPDELERFADWMRLAELLYEHERALLLSFRFPMAQLGVLHDFARHEAGEEPPAEHDLRAETLGRIAILVPELQKHALRTAVAINEPEMTWPMGHERLRHPPAADDGDLVERVLRDLS